MAISIARGGSHEWDIGSDERDRPSLSFAELARVESLAGELRRKHPQLDIAPELAGLVAATSGPSPALHLDDQSDISFKGARHDASHIQDRARIRAFDGDLVACNVPPVEGYETYCREHLGLGRVEWLAPQAARYRRNLSSHCWTVRQVRKRLIRAVKSEHIRCIHPLMGSAAVWQLALLLGRATRRRVSVLAPPPGVTRLVNDKTEFASIVVALLGENAFPQSYAATSLAIAARHVKELVSNSARVAVKIPDGAGGAGNIVLESGPLRQKSLDEVRAHFAPILRCVGWRSGERLQISAWADDVVSAPSVQTWIPPGDRRPSVDGVFEQLLEGPNYEFSGTTPAKLPAGIHDYIASRALLLATLFQRLGYVGRCSFDLVVTRRTLETGAAVLIECNGRWGGTSLPMRLVQRLFDRDSVPPYVVRSLLVPGMSEVPFRHVLERFENHLYDVRTRDGWLVLFNPGRIRAQSGLSYITLGTTREEALHRADELFSLAVSDLARFSRPRTRVRLH